jgi:tetratricopeptide (TPR) repeat protein
MSIKKLILPVLLLLLVTSSCRLADKRFKQAYAETLAQNRSGELILALLELDQSYPDRLSVKITLGGMLLAAGDLDRARIVLERGEELARRCRDDELRGLLFTNLAELCYRQGEYSRGAASAEKALRCAPNQRHGVVFTRAKCLAALGRYGEALRCFRQARETEPMSGEDMEIFAALLVNRGDYGQALEVLSDRELEHGYALGLGLQQSAVYEQTGQFGEAVIAAAKDMEYRRSLGLVKDTRVLENLQRLSGILPAGSSAPPGRGQAATRAFTAFVRGQWRQCVSALAEPDDETRLPFADYLLLASLLEIGGAEPEVLAAYRGLEPRFLLLPAYHYHLWRGLKAGAGSYDIFSARTVLETCILLAPRARYARKSRAELGLLLGMSAREGEKLLLGAELDALYDRLASGADPKILKPALDMLPLPGSIYRTAAVMLLEKARGLPGVADYLDQQPQPAAQRAPE